ncbi:hypothetical protein HYPSUDRAFT_133726 [Hypholoma sublateritium FD-334 SS-4]|uniref:DH domain-containing protein n=1 Tax=Hypholoma sublateritium (strain FD-334 SS-4) TaxID=945553 RepID=A0A0D2MQB3_HYPSF|nr:hypothetical protein HYPSUDRAFT_133726 [Hypholoma sublateritium FD-334 SS-4]
MDVPPLSSAASSAASTRSSAYTTAASALAYADPVRVADPDDHLADSILKMLASDPAQSPSARVPAARTRWSEYSASVRSRSSSLGNSLAAPPPPLPTHDYPASPPLSQKPSYDVTWDSKDTSEDDTDDDPSLDDDPIDDDDERTSAAVLADEGTGLIVHGDNVPVSQLHIPPGTTHLLIGSSSTPNAVPSFLTSVLPQIAHSLLALDISNNFLGALPPVLADCEVLEELNVASNPLRVLPVFLADLSNLRVLIADSTGITTLPDVLVDLDKLHTISIRRNKFHALPSWFCLLPALQTLCVDNNPFQGPWKALVDPLLAKLPSTPVYPPSTPMMPNSASIHSWNADTETDGTDNDDYSDQEPNGFHQSPEEEDHTITPERGPFLARATTSPLPASLPVPQPKPLVRTRTTPNRAYFDEARAKASPAPDPRAQFQPVGRNQDVGDPHEIRKMKSAGDLRRQKYGGPGAAVPESELPRPPLMHYATSLSSSNLLSMAPPAPAAAAGSSAAVDYPKRFASLGPSAQLAGGPARAPPNAARPQLSQSMWGSTPAPIAMSASMMEPDRSSSYTAARVQKSESYDNGKPSRGASREKSSRWGFLKKMSMGKIKPETPSPPGPSPAGSPNPPRAAPRVARAHTASAVSGRANLERVSETPQIDLRLSSTGMLDALPSLVAPPSPSAPPRMQLNSEAMPPPGSSSGAGGLLAPPGAANGLLLPPRATKRRSFLPLEAPGMMALTIPESAAFMPGVVVAHDGEASPALDGVMPAVVGASPVRSEHDTHEQHARRAAERAREAYMRALRSVMAYLKDMNDLGAVQQAARAGARLLPPTGAGHPMSMYDDDNAPEHGRARRPTLGEADVAGHLRLADAAAARSGTSSQTLSVATTDSSGSGEERKFKDDRSKRANLVREIVATERTYVNGLQELVDIYIKPAATPANLLGGVGSSSKETVVPPAERRVVFGGIDALFSFHQQNFLPALEGAAAPLMAPAAAVHDADHDGQLSLEVAKAVGAIFVKHAAFMKMYSSYINNFDSSVQRVKYWTSDRNTPAPAAPGPALTSSPSTSQLVGLGLGMALASTPSALAAGDAAATGIPNLTTGQRRRIKAYLKRCRLNPRHAQLNLEGYLLLPVQRVPRYKLLLEELLRSTPPVPGYADDPLERALAEIALLANNMNEGKRASESRRKLVQWQARIRGKFPSPLVQPHRRLIMDGPLLLTRVVRKAVVAFEAITTQGDAATVQVDCLAPELTPRALIGILCNDLLVLCRDPSEGQDPAAPVDLWAVLRMQTLPQPASIVHGNALRLVDNKAILYFDAPSPSAALNWYRAINLHIPASKT